MSVQFGWIAPVIGVEASGGQPIIVQEHENGVLAAVNEYFDSVWVADHFHGFDNLDDPYLEAWTSMSWLAASYPKLLVGASVMSNNYRDPALMAQMSKTFQAFSKGRLVLGYGAGWREPEYNRHGIPFERPAARIKQLEEGLQIIKSMWTQPRTTFHGKYYQVTDAICEPKPDPIPPILIGGSGEKLMLRLVAQYADWWNTGGPVDRYEHKMKVLEQHCQDVGRDFNSIVKTLQIEVAAPQDSEGSKKIVETLRPYVELGVSHFMLDFGVVTDPDVVKRIGEEAFSALR
jgi:alkanesulfonate monooxygenase SsuD/methylene tetrahydromethanopterin reductase-like flavin-dependent oxidoreductase (luciferase family)